MSGTADEALCELSATDAARQIAAGTLSPVALTEAVLARVCRLDPVLRFLAASMADQARDAAQAAEAAVRAGLPLGPLHGVPVTIKDNLAVAGVPMRQGSAAAPAVVPGEDAAVVQRVRAAGAIIIGKTTLPEFAHKVLTDNPVDGATRNPWRLDRTPGGSSGGAATALAAGVGPLALGTDGGGSVRCPASCTGTVGLKATLGVVPNEAAPDGFGNFYFTGPMARTVADLRLLLSVLRGAHRADPYSLASAPPQGRPPRDLRVGWVEHFGRYRTEAETARVTTAAVAKLAEAGARVEAVAPACFMDVYGTYRVLATAAHAARMGHLVDSHALTPSMRDSIQRGMRWSGAEVIRAQDRRTALFRGVQALFEQFDVVVTPTVTAPPPGLDAGGSIATDWYAAWAAPLYPFNLTGHPAMSVPAGLTADGLPVGLQLVGGWHAEAALLDAAAAVESALGPGRLVVKSPWRGQR